MTHRSRVALTLTLLVASGGLFAGCKDKKDDEKSKGSAQPGASARQYLVQVYADGPGRVSIEPSRSDGRYAEGTRVTLRAVPEAGRELVSWSGDASGSETRVTIVVRGNVSATARFDYPESERHIRSVVEDLLTAARSSGTSAETLEEKVGAVANAFGDLRDDLYQGIAQEDEAFAQQLLRCGEDTQALANLEELVLQEVGAWEFFPGRTVSYKLLYTGEAGLPNCSVDVHRGHYGSWLGQVKEQVSRMGEVPGVADSALTPREALPRSGSRYRLASTWRLSGNRRQVFEQERRVYEEAARLAQGAAQARLREEVDAVDELRTVDDELLAVILQDVSLDSLDASSGTTTTSTGATGALNDSVGR